MSGLNFLKSQTIKSHIPSFLLSQLTIKNASAACPQKAPSEGTRLSCSNILAPPPTSSVFVPADRPFQVIVAKAEQGKQTSIWRKTYICHFTEQTHTWFWFEELLKVSHLSLIRRIMFPWRAAPFLLISLGVWGGKKATISLESQRYHFISSLTHPYTTPSFEGHPWSLLSQKVDSYCSCLKLLGNKH